MGLFGKSGGAKNNEPLLALDIGTDVVKALIFVPDFKNKKGNVIGVGRTRQKYGNMRSGAISDISGVIEASKDAIASALKQAQIKRVKSAIMGIAGELVKGTTTTVHYERPNPEDKIDLPELKNIIQKVQWKAYDRIKEQLVWELGRDIDIKLINAAIVDVRIDGYRITNPLDFQGKSVSVSIFNAYAPMLHLGALDSIAKELKVDLMSIAAEPFAVSSSVGYEDALDFSAIFIDVGGGTTDVAVVRNGGLEGTKMFALGGRAFTHRLEKELNINFDEAEALKLKYSHGKLARESTDQINGFLEGDSQVWVGGVELSLMEFAETDLLPSTIYLCGGGSGLPNLQVALSRPEWTQNLPFTKTPKISFLQPKDVAHIVDQTGMLVSPQDVTPMGLANLAIDLADNERVMANILRRAMRSIQS